MTLESDLMRRNERMADLVGISYSRKCRTVLQIKGTQFRFFDNIDWLDNKSACLISFAKRVCVRYPGPLKDVFFKIEAYDMFSHIQGMFLRSELF